MLEEACPRRKAALTHDAYARLARGEIEVCGEKYLDTVRTLPNRPARPEKPRLVSPKEVPSPKNSPLGPTAHVVHGLAHVELNAVDLAWDTVARFASLRGVLPDQFFIDFAHVADDESRHLLWCLQRLEELGVSYGDVPAHDLLWEGAEATANDPLARLAVVPCMQEARGLDAGPRLAERLVGHGDNVSAAIVRRISEEELGHVAVTTMVSPRRRFARTFIVSRRVLCAGRSTSTTARAPAFIRAGTRRMRKRPYRSLDRLDSSRAIPRS